MLAGGSRPIVTSLNLPAGNYWIHSQITADMTSPAILDCGTDDARSNYETSGGPVAHPGGGFYWLRQNMSGGYMVTYPSPTTVRLQCSAQPINMPVPDGTQLAQVVLADIEAVAISNVASSH